MLDELYSDIRIQYTTYEDLFIREKLHFKQALAQAVTFTGEGHTGVELDLDCVQFALSSDTTPVGFTALQARQYASFLSHHPNIAYLHIAEGAAQLINGQQSAFTAKLICDITVDFIKGNRS